MSEKPKLHYPNGRGRMETVRWVLAAAGVEVLYVLFLHRFAAQLGDSEQNTNGGALI